MRLILVWLLYSVGHMLSYLLAVNCFSWVYPVYKWLMIKSSDLDIDCVVWKKPK